VSFLYVTASASSSRRMVSRNMCGLLRLSSGTQPHQGTPACVSWRDCGTSRHTCEPCLVDRYGQRPVQLRWDRPARQRLVREDSAERDAGLGMQFFAWTIGASIGLLRGEPRRAAIPVTA
jgi:hypothetical protein